MDKKTEKTRLHVCLDKQTYTILKQKAAYKKMSIKRFLKVLATEKVILKYEIAVYEMEGFNEGLNRLICEIGSYYDRMVARSRGHQEEANMEHEKGIQLYENLSAYMMDFYKKLADSRENAIKEEAERIEDAISKVQKSSYRDLTAHIASPKNYDVDMVLTLEERERIAQNMELAGKKEISLYMRKLILAKYYISLSWKMQDLNLMVESIYQGSKYAMAIIRLGGESESEIFRLKELSLKAEQIQEAIWIIVENDRKHLYRKYLPRVSEPRQGTMKSKKKAGKENMKWQSQG